MAEDPLDTKIEAITRTAHELARAELRHDLDYLEEALDGDFVMIDADGQVLDRSQFLVGHISGDLEYRELVRTDVAVHVHDGAAVAVCDDVQRGHHRSRSFDRHCRTTLFLVESDDEWRLAAEHVSRIA